MIILTYLIGLLLIGATLTMVLLAARLRLMRAAEQARESRSVDISRYEPMARLFARRDLDALSSDKVLTTRLRKHRARVMRGYLRCLTKDFGALLGGIRLSMVRATEDQPDRALLLVRSRWHFGIALCRAEVKIRLYEFGIGTVDLSGLLGQVDALRQLTPGFSAA